jgi:hypothetical protein
VASENTLRAWRKAKGVSLNCFGLKDTPQTDLLARLVFR